MALVMLIIALIVPMAFGAVIVHVLFKSKLPSFLVLLPLSFFVGSAFLTMLLFLLSLLNIPWSGTVIGLISMSAIGGVLATYFPRRKKLLTLLSHKRAALSWLYDLRLSGREWVLLFFILVNVATFTYLAVNKPVVNWDAWANWSLRAKVFYFERGIPMDPNHPYFLGRGGHVNYPLHLPIFEAWTYIVLGQWNDQMMKIIFPLYTAFFALFVYALVRLITYRIYALLFCLLFALLPFVAYHSFAEYADLPTGLYLGMATGAAWLFVQTKQKGYVLVASLLLAQSGWVKNEGLFLGVIAIVALCIYLRKHFIPIVLPAILFIAPWLMFKQLFGLGMSNFGATSGMGMIAFHKEAISLYIQELSRIENVGLLWIALVVILIFNRSIIRQLKLGIFLMLVIVFLAVYGGIYVLTDNVQFALSGVVIQRNLLTIVPTAFWVVAVVWARTLTDGKNTVQ